MAGTEKRFQTRMPFHVHEKLAQAAALSGSTLNHFLIQSALEKANAVIEQERVLNLSYADAQVVFEAAENPPEPNDELIRAAKGYKQEFGNEPV